MFTPGIISVLIVLLFTSNYKAIHHHKTPVSVRAHFTLLPTTFNYFVLVMFIFGISNFNKTLLIYKAQEQFSGAGNSFLIASSSAILLYVLFNVIRALGEFISGSVSDYVPRKFLLACGFGLFSIVTLLLLFVQTQLLLWIIIFMSAGLSTGIITAVEKSYAAELLPQQVRGTGFGFLQSIDGLGDLISSIIVGALWTYHSPNAAFIYSFLMSIAALLLILVHKK